MSPRTSLFIIIGLMVGVGVVLLKVRPEERVVASSGGLAFSWDKPRQELTVALDASGTSDAVLVPTKALGTLVQGSKRWTLDGAELDATVQSNEMVLDWSNCVVLRRGYSLAFRVRANGKQRIEINVGRAYAPSLERDCAQNRIQVWMGEVSLE